MSPQLFDGFDLSHLIFFVFCSIFIKYCIRQSRVIQFIWTQFYSDIPLFLISATDKDFSFFFWRLKFFVMRNLSFQNYGSIGGCCYSRNNDTKISFWLVCLDRRICFESRDKESRYILIKWCLLWWSFPVTTGRVLLFLDFLNFLFIFFIIS